MSTTTIFSSTVPFRFQVDIVYKILESWLEYQEIDGLKKHGFYLTYLSQEKIIAFNFFIVNESGMTDDQREKIWAILESQNFCILKEVVKQIPAK